MSKTLKFRDKEFTADFIVKTEKSIIFYNKSNEEINRLQPLSPNLSDYVIYNADGTIGTFDTANFNSNVISTGTDMMRIIYALMKENTQMKADIAKLKGGA